jgi:hypothetical protein
MIDIEGPFRAFYICSAQSRSSSNNKKGGFFTEPPFNLVPGVGIEPTHLSTRV